MGKKKYVCRLGVKSQDGRQSSVWSIWAAKPRDDRLVKSCVYIAARSLGGVVKASLHEGKDWRVAFTREYVNRLISSGDWDKSTRLIQKWIRPLPNGNGLTLAFRLVFPSCELVEHPSSSDDVYWISPETVGSCTEVILFFASPTCHVSSWPGKKGMNSKFINRFELANGETLWIVSVEAPTRKEIYDNIQAWKNHASPHVSDDVDLTEPRYRMAMFGSEPDESRTIIDLAAC